MSRLVEILRLVDSIRGAQQLQERLQRRLGSATAGPATLDAVDALPVFHWVGVEPPMEHSSESETLISRRRWWRGGRRAREAVA